MLRVRARAQPGLLLSSPSSLLRGVLETPSLPRSPAPLCAALHPAGIAPRGSEERGFPAAGVASCEEQAALLAWPGLRTSSPFVRSFTEENPLLPGLAGQTREPGVLGKGWVWDGSFGAGWDVRGWSVAFQHLGRPPRLLGSVAAPASSGEAGLRGVSAGKQAALPLSRAAPSA